MKILCSVLITLLLLHLQCGGSCLSEALTRQTSEDPPCHQHSQTPTNDQHSTRHVEGPCTQGPLIAAKLSFGKAVLQSDATIPDAIETTPVTDFEPGRQTNTDPRFLLPPPATISVLRI